MKRILFPGLMLLVLASAGQAQQPAAKDQSAAKPRKKLDADLSGFDVSEDKSGKKVSTMLGGTRSAAVPSATLLAPRRAKFYGASADFAWAYGNHNDGYILLVTDEDETQLVHQPVKDSHYLSTDLASKLQPGETYYWRVQVLPNTLASEPSEFVVVSADERKAIDKAIATIPAGDAYQSGLARARIFVDHRLWFDAVGAYNDLIAKNPNKSELYEDRATIYAQIPTTKSLSEADKAHAAQLPK